MRVTYDKQVDAAYIYLKKTKKGDIVKTYVCDNRKVGGMIHLDFDRMGVLVGIEVVGAKRLLPKGVLEKAK